MACPEGLEPPTYCLEGNCSIRLSYGQLVQPKERIIPGSPPWFDELAWAAAGVRLQVFVGAV